jgi:chemotaxis protein histidine kinase CheA/CheY-like chemotaxis protein
MNSEQQQQRIMGYFIEEAREHLQTIEQGVLNLQDVLHDSESTNELFRAAHSIKGGAAMLGVGSIQHVAHRLEDFFKILKENPQINVDERLKSLLLAGFDPLSELLDELQGGFRISEELTAETNNRVKPVFAEVESYLNQLVSDADGEISADAFIQEEESFTQPQKVVISQESVFQQEITTKMRDMLQLFRATDNAESRSQLQAVCNHFQEIGSNFDLQNWTRLVTQIKNAIAQPSNSYRTLAPILIRELKEAQDLVLANREAEIAVSSQLQNLLPYRFLESEDDEISTIFTPASGNISEELDIKNLEISDANITRDDLDLAINPDVDIDLFADQVNEESFDLVEVQGNQIEQMDWMDSEYEITENQHIDGPKIGASELKSLAILFENDDIDFDAAWEDIESNETNISNQGSPTISDSHDEFADLLDNVSDNSDVTVPNLSNEESSIDQLFGDFPTQGSTTEEISSSLFPDDLEDSWQVTSDISPEIEQTNLDGLFTEDFVTDDALDNQFDIDLGTDIVEQFSDSDIADAIQINDQFDDQFDDDINISGINIDDIDFSELSEHTTTHEESVEHSLFNNSQDDSQSLSSEEYFAAIARQESETFDDNIPSDPFALTFSEEGMTLLEDPFAIDESIDEKLLNSANSISSSISSDEIVSSDSDVDNFFEDSEDVESEIDEEPITGSNESDVIDTTGFSIFDDLGFDSDELDEQVVPTQEFDGSVNTVSNIALEESPDNFLTSQVEDSDFGDDLSFLDESNGFIEDAISTTNNSELDDGFNSSLVDGLASDSVDVFDNDAINGEINNAGDLDDFFTDSLEDENRSDDISTDNFIDGVNSPDELGDFFSTAEEDEISNSINNELPIFDDYLNNTGEDNELDNFTTVQEAPATITNDISDRNTHEFEPEFTSSNDLDDFFSESEPTVISEDSANSHDSTDESSDFGISTTDDLNDFFADSEESTITSSDTEEKLDISFDTVNNTDDLGAFFDISEDDQSLAEDDWDDFSTIATGGSKTDIGNIVDIDDEENAFINFDSPQNISEGENSTDLEGAFLDQINDADNDDWANLLFDGEKEDLTGVENALNFEQDFEQDELLTQSDEINDLASMLDDELEDATFRTIESDLTSIQEELNLEDADITAKTTIDNLADFFQGDHDEDASVLEMPVQLASDDVVINTPDVPIDFDGFSEFLDVEISEASNFLQVQAPEEKNLEIENQLQTEELNGIDDNFDFDDLEAMIGNSSATPNDSSNVSNRLFDNQATETVINNQTSVNFDDMNFDELEALLGDSGDFDDSETTKPATYIDSIDSLDTDTLVASSMNSSDGFDELESLLQNRYSDQVGRLETKTPTRPPTTVRKPKLSDSTMRVDVKYLDSLNNLVGELVVNRNLLEQDQERLQQFITNLLHQVQLLSDVSQRMRDQYDRSLLEASLSAGRGGRSYSSSFESVSYSGDGENSNNSVSNDFEGIEFDRYNTFHVLSQEIIELIVRVRESASDIEFVVGETDQVTRQLGTITTQVQDDLKQSRMVPFAQIGDRLPRGIRDRALKTGKQAELEIFGRETLIDKAILEQLTDPLTHLVNNAIDHGLEDPVTRQAAGKSATGRLTVRAYHQGNQTVISISDDGAGISTDKVKKSAVAKGVRSQSEVNRLNDTEVYGLLFEAGFSTAAQADEFKGRGVGLDVVKTCLDDIRGVIIVESVVGKGTTFTIRLPLTLSISKAMFCISDRGRIAFPVDGFEDMVEVPQNQIVLDDKGQPCLPWRDTVLPFQHLSNLLSYSRHISRSSIYGKQENDELCIIILRNDTSYLALQVDQFLGEYEIVIKQLEGPIPQPAGIAGATVLGDGRVMAIANVLELFDIASGRLRPSTSSITIKPMVEEEVAADPTVLIVDDSITVRELLSLTFAKVGYRVEQAKDGQDAWEKLRAGLPCDMIFCDIEMPRMDGLDLLSRLQKDARLKDIPVAMLTSRGADRHRQSAIQLGAKGYFTKPYLEEELLSASKRLLAGETLPI